MSWCHIPVIFGHARRISVNAVAAERCDYYSGLAELNGWMVLIFIMMAFELRITY